MCVITFIVLEQFIIYNIQLERDFAGWFISASVLLTSLIILVQTLATAKGLQVLMLELLNIDSMLGSATGSRRHFSAIFYTMYCIGFTRGIFRMLLMIQLGLRSPSFAVQLLIPSLIVLARVNQQIYLMELIASQLKAIAAELSSALEDDGRCNNATELETAFRWSCTLQRTEYLFGRLQKCLLMVNTQFGWSTAAIVVLVFIGITFQFRVPMHPFPFYAQIVEILYSIFILFCLCRSSCHATERVNEIKRVLLKPFYNSSLWDQVHNFIVRTKLQPFEFTANGLYSINYSLFGSVIS
uniref:Gustatory receptor n=1 Tax=Anopheles christyi TaxID=43041 RepID=A0A182JNP9_9DIPT